MHAEDRSPLDGATILTNARALHPLLRHHTDEIERERQLPAPVVDAMRRAGVFRMPMPRSWGGPELDILTQLEIVETVSQANGSAGWCAMIGSDGGFCSAYFRDDVARELWPSLDAVTAGWLYPVGRLVPEVGGYRLSGRWAFGSGCTHADVIVSGALVWDGDALALDADGRPEWRVAVLPAGAIEVIDTWETTGLAGSGSHDYAIEGRHVPAEHTFRFGDAPTQRDGALYRWPGMFLGNIPGVPLGIARDALDTAEALLADKISLPLLVPAKDQALVRVAVSRAEALVGAARAYVFDVLGDFWTTVEAGGTPTMRQRAALGGSYVHVFRSCREAVQTLYDALGTSAIYRSCPLDRHLRDLLTIAQHVLAQPKMLEPIGQLWFGDDPGHPLL